MIRVRTIALLFVCAVVCGAWPRLALAQSGSTAAQPAAATAGKPVLNLNSATVDQLESLPGIGRKTAELIVEYRTKSGGFKRVEDLMNVKGIGEKSFLKLKPLVVVKTAEKAPAD